MNRRALMRAYWARMIPSFTEDAEAAEQWFLERFALETA